MASYLTVAQFKLYSIIPDEDIATLQDRYPDFLITILTARSAWIDSRLRKRYAAPFEEPYPEAVKGWLAALATVPAYLKRGVDASDAQFTEVLNAKTIAEQEILEAANSETGLFDLPLRQDTTADGISKGEPLGYAEADPYTWTDLQEDDFR